MNVGELKKMLQQYPDDMEIVNRRYSDYEIISVDDFSLIEGVDKGGWVMTAHPTMSEDNKIAMKKYLSIWGN